MTSKQRSAFSFCTVSVVLMDIAGEIVLNLDGSFSLTFSMKTHPYKTKHRELQPLHNYCFIFSKLFFFVVAKFKRFISARPVVTEFQFFQFHDRIELPVLLGMSNCFIQGMKKGRRKARPTRLRQ